MTGKQTAPATGITERLKKLDTYIPVEYSMRFIMAFLLARARIFSDFAPFGTAFVAAAPGGAAGIITLVGAIAGSLTIGNMLLSVKYIAACLLIRAALRIFRNTPAGRLKLFPPFTAFVSMACIGVVYAFDSGWQLQATVLYVVETFLSGGCAYFYNVALSPWTSTSGRFDRTCHGVSSVILLATLLMSVSTLNLFGVLSIGRCAAVIVVMFSVFRGGMGLGCSCAAAIGAAMDLSCGAAPFFTMSYTFTAMISGVFSKNGRLLFLLSFIAGSTISVLWTWEYCAMLPALYETFAASVIFMLLPDSLLARIGAMLPSEASGYGFLKAREYTRDRVELTSEAFKSLFDAVRSACGEDQSENISYVFDRASEQVCRSCPNSAKCWQKEYVDTVDIMNNITPMLLKNGSVSKGDLPSRFSDSCLRIDELINAINSETRTFLCRRQYRQRLKESRGAAYNQYYDIASVLHSLSEELGSEITVEPSLERKLQKYLRGLNIDASTAIFRVRGGRLRAEIRSSSLYILRKDSEYLNKLSAVLGTRLCTPDGHIEPDRLVLLEAEPLAAAIGVASLKKNGETISGDRGVYFRTDEGYLYVLLSDGMGSGAEAARMSADTTGILERFLKAGVAPELTLRILSDLMLLKNDTELESATVDMLCLNMFTGESKIFKFGAAPSYLKKDSTVRRVNCGTFPAGLIPGVTSMKNVYVKLKLMPGAFAIMISDGVIAGGSDKWLKELIAKYEGSDPKELSRKILEAAVINSGCSDDMTVLAVRTDERA
ncbi:MAG: SpoIIE family protein phosphatase [Oscillospiraceae bacterium]